MTTIIRAGSAAEFLSLVPRLARCTPRKSLALVPFTGGSAIGVLRLDLPTGRDADELDRIAATAIGLACRLPTVDRLALVIYTDDPLRDGAALAHDTLAQAVLRRAHDCGLEPVNALCVAADGWSSYLSPESEHGTLDEIAAADVSGDDGDVTGDQYAGTELPAANPARKESVDLALLSMHEAAESLLAAPEEISDVDLYELADDMPDAEAIRSLLLALHTLPALWDAALDGDPKDLDPTHAALMLWLLDRPPLRDVALAVWCDGIDEGVQIMAAQDAWENGAPYRLEGPLRLMGEGPRPDPDRLLRALELMRHLAALAPLECRPSPLAVAAWLSWALGRSSHASWYLERAAELAPTHSLATIVASLISAAHLPDWAYDRFAPPASRPTSRPSSKRARRRQRRGGQ